MGTEAMAIDPNRLHQLPVLGYDNYKRVIQRSWVPLLDRTLHLELELDGSHGQWLPHCCQCNTSRREMIISGEQGQLVDFFDPDAPAQQVDHLCKTINSVKGSAKTLDSTFSKVVMT